MKDVIKTGRSSDGAKRRKQNTAKRSSGTKNGNAKVLYAIAVFFVILIAMILCLTVFFNITSIDVKGVTLYRTEQILDVGGVSEGLNLVRVNTDNIKKRLEENLAYIEDVNIEKKYFSNKLIISCTEAEKAADILCDDSYYVISTSGKILEAKNPYPTGKGIPVIEGFELKSKDTGAQLESEDSFKADILTELLEYIKELEFDNITAIDLSSRADIILNYDDRIEIKLGSSVDMDYKLSYFKAVIDEKLTADYEGTLIYNGADSGISAIPKEQMELMLDTDSSAAEDTSEAMTEDDSAAEADAWTDGGDLWQSDDETDGGYDYDYGTSYDTDYTDGTDHGNYDTDYGSETDYGYDDGNTDDGGYAGGETDYGAYDGGYGQW